MQFWNTPRRTNAALLGMIAVAALWGGMTGTAHAQSAGNPSDPFRIKVGGWFPYDTDTRREIGGNFISFGVGYDIKQFNSFLPATLEGYIDYFDRKRGGGTDRRDARLFGGGIAVRYSLAPNAGPNPMYRPYAGAGIGIYTSRASRTAVINDNTIAQRNDRTSIGGKFLLGTELRNGIFGEAEYNFVPHPSVFGNDVELSGFQVRLGYRFGVR